MQSILNRLIEKIKTADIDPLPSDNIYMEQIFDPAIYAEILARLPADNVYHFIEHPDAVLPDGTITRKLLDLTDETIQTMNANDQEFWRKMKDVFTSQELCQVIAEKFKLRIKERYGEQFPEMVVVPIFYRDYPGYRIGVHTDAPFKIATLQFYFPEDESQIHLGTSFHLKQGNSFPLLKTNQFKPNSGYAFVRTDTSWHSVQQMQANESKRNTLALTVYIKGQEYKSTSKKYE